MGTQYFVRKEVKAEKAEGPSLLDSLELVGTQARMRSPFCKLLRERCMNTMLICKEKWRLLKG